MYRKSCARYSQIFCNSIVSDTVIILCVILVTVLVIAVLSSIQNAVASVIHIKVIACRFTDSTNLISLLFGSSIFTARRHSLLCQCCICHGRVCPSVRLSFRHTLVLCRDE